MPGNLTSIKEPRGRKIPVWLFNKFKAQGKWALPSGVSSLMLQRLRDEKDLRYWPHPYRSVSEMCEAHGLPDARFKGWRLTDYVLGYFNACPDVRGRMMATNGVMCLLRGERDVIHTIHLDAFVHENNLEPVEYAAKERKPRTPTFSLADFLRPKV